MASGGQISIEDAVDQLHQMFGDYDKAALAAVLEAHGGHMERTVEHLLSGAGTDPSASGGGGPPSGTDHDADLALQLSREWSDQPAASMPPPPPTIPSGIPGPFDRGTSGGSGRGGGYAGGFASAGSGGSQGAASSVGNTSGGGGSDRRGRRVALPEEFLRVPGWTGGGVSSDPQVAADARLAMMLQNESFQRELQAHPDLAHLGRGGLGFGNNRYRVREGEAAASTGPSIKDQLADIGNDVRRKVEELAVRWKMRDPGSAADTTDYSAVPLMSSTHDDDDQAEVVHFAQDNTTRRSHSGGSGSGFQSEPPASSGLFLADSAGEERLADPRRIKKDR